MPKLPVLKPKQVFKILMKRGFVKLRQSGSHLILFNESGNLKVTLPMHNKDLKRKTLKSIFDQAKVRL
jgi:predicted RNA binding protein YcfA (HicA-like mRNA interferase family)